MELEMDVSLYPMGQTHVVHPVHDFVEVLRKHGCTVENSPTSLIVSGQSQQLFEALRLGYEEAARNSGCVMVVKACNVCPL